MLVRLSSWFQLSISSPSRRSFLNGGLAESVCSASNSSDHLSRRCHCSHVQLDQQIATFPDIFHTGEIELFRTIFTARLELNVSSIHPDEEDYWIILSFSSMAGPRFIRFLAKCRMHRGIPDTVGECPVHLVNVGKYSNRAVGSHKQLV